MKKFTLIEMLVVLALIALLVTLLLPSLGQARERAKQAVCLSNMKQISVAVEMYKKTYNLRLPKCVGAISTNWNGSAHNQEWKTLLDEFLNGNFALGLLDCPSRDKANATAGGLGWNLDYLPYAPIDKNNPDRQIYHGYKFLSITNPYETFLVGDTPDVAGWNSKVCRKPSGFLDRVGDRHFGKTNVLWADSHVSTETEAKMVQGKNGKQNWYYLADKENQN
ncbi:MAG: prepilin-type N-terminal cleavage/methylation domain-containing protein [Lentisphaerales bacterium]|nr:prepilin-type N-terminal cleavage/methylation domain-containing protein [Lentisphaerales bacterium]